MAIADRDADLSTIAPRGRAAAAGLGGWRLVRTGAATRKVGRRDLGFILHNLAALVDNGLSLPKALGTLARERSLRRHAGMLADLRGALETGETFSNALARYSATFNEVMVSQVRAGERAGTVGAALTRIAAQLENRNRVRGQVIRRLAYPAVLVVAGALAVTFMLLFVIPVFEGIYAEAGVPLPAVTRLLMAAGRWAVAYGGIVPLAGLGAVVAWRQTRKKRAVAVRIDGAVLRAPLVGNWLRNLAVLQFMDVFGDLVQSGIRVIDALEVSARSVANRAVRQSVRELHAAVARGERLGRELDRLGDLFPPVVSQLIAVGERTGGLPKATLEIRRHLEQEIERQTSVLVGTIEPVLTICLAAAVGFILLAIYLPMFDMIGAVGRM